MRLQPRNNQFLTVKCNPYATKKAYGRKAAGFFFIMQQRTGGPDALEQLWAYLIVRWLCRATKAAGIGKTIIYAIGEKITQQIRIIEYLVKQ